jgi:uncharacterized protein
MHFAVIREHGSSWDESRSMREQRHWAEHAEFMDALARDRVIVVGGPVGDGSRTLLIMDAETEEAIRSRLADDPWTTRGLLRIASIEAWQILLGGLD